MLTMMALVKEKDGQMHIKEVDIPKVGGGEVLIEVKAVGICGSDIRLYRNKHIFFPPVIIGHEFSGVIKEVGAGVKEWSVGDRVTCEPHALSCGECAHCKKGNIHICASKRSLGWGVDGACADYISVSKSLLHKIPDSMSFEEAAVLEPTAIVTHALLERTQITAGDFVVVLGAGTIGLLSAMVAQVKVSHEVMKLTNNFGADVVIEASGAEAAANMAVDIVRKHGKIGAIGESGDDAWIRLA